MLVLRASSDNLLIERVNQGVCGLKRRIRWQQTANGRRPRARLWSFVSCCWLLLIALLPRSWSSAADYSSSARKLLFQKSRGQPILSLLLFLPAAARTRTRGSACLTTGAQLPGRRYYLPSSASNLGNSFLFLVALFAACRGHDLIFVFAQIIRNARHHPHLPRNKLPDDERTWCRTILVFFPGYCACFSLFQHGNISTDTRTSWLVLTIDFHRRK